MLLSKNVNFLSILEIGSNLQYKYCVKTIADLPPHLLVSFTIFKAFLDYYIPRDCLEVMVSN